jgi:hypothetical protein
MKTKYRFVILAVVAVLFIPTAQVSAYTVSGSVDHPGEYSTQGSLWTVLQGTKPINNTPPYAYPCSTDPTIPCITYPDPVWDMSTFNHDWADSDYVVVTGRDGSKALYSVGELDPQFGNAAVTVTCSRPDRCSLSGEGRTVHDVTDIEVVHAVSIIKLSGGVFPFTHFYSPYVIVSGAGITPRTYALADLKAMKQVTFTSTTPGKTQGAWTGPTLLSVLKASGIDTSDMDSYMVVQATDGYAAVLSMYEATQLTGAQHQNALLAISVGSLPASSTTTLNETPTTTVPTTPPTKETSSTPPNQTTDSGVARLILPNDGGTTSPDADRWISNVAQIVVYKLKDCWGHWDYWR